MTRVESFLKQHQQASAQIEVKPTIESVHSEMSKALASSSSLPMIPTYLAPAQCKRHGKKILIDAGGTNFRSAIGYFDDNGRAIIDRMSNNPMPGVTSKISGSQFFQCVADNIAHLLDDGDDVGFCFSYAVDMSKDIDGTILDMSKEIKIDNALGMPVGKSTLDAIATIDGRPRRAVVLNDTVATLLGGYATCDSRQYGGYIGYIYGTGTNVCYIEKTANITKINDSKLDNMIINVEAAHFDKFILGDYDKLAIAKTSGDNHYFEKVTSGRYLAEVINQCILGAIHEQIFECTVTPCQFELKDISLFLAGEHNVVYDMFECTQDRTSAKEIAREMIDRAAKLGAIFITAAAMLAPPAKDKKLAVVCEGSTFKKLTGFRPNFVKYLDSILGEQRIAYDIIEGDNFNMVGTLMATMMLYEE